MNIHNKIKHLSLIPRLGYWTYDKDVDEFYWSKETCILLNWPTTKPFPKLKEFISMVNQEDQPEMIKAFNRLYDHASDGYGIELRIIDNYNSEHYNWYHIIGKANNSVLFGIIIDINKRKSIENKNAQLHKQLLIFAKQAGMAEVARSVIHNIGNVLNGATTSISILEDKIKNTSYKKFAELIPLMQEHQKSLSDYLTQDPKGKKIPEYIIALGNSMQQEYEKIVSEILNISQCIHHIKQIICTQESVSNSCSLKEKVNLSEILDISINFFNNNVSKHNININKDYQDNVYIFVEQSNLMQILVNLIKNSIDAVIINTEQINKQINISINQLSKALVAIKVADNGIGISQENINKIFSFGFTTKPDGHGFGLHNCAIKAKEMGGNLYAKSEGEGKGAIFTLTLPLNVRHGNQSIETKYE